MKMKKKEMKNKDTFSCHLPLHLYGCPCIYSCFSSLPRQGFSPSAGHGLQLSLSLSLSQLIMGIPCAILKEEEKGKEREKVLQMIQGRRIKCFRK